MQNDRKADEKVSSDLLQEVRKAQEATGKLVQLAHEARSLVQRSSHRDHLLEVAGYIYDGVPEALSALQGALGQMGVLLSKAEKRASYRSPVEDIAGVQTLVRRNEDVSEGVSDQDRSQEVALPKTPDRKPGYEERRPLPTDDPSGDTIPRAQFNVPPMGEPGNDIDSTRTRMRPEPGDQRGVPYKDTPLLTRRTLEGVWARAVRQACWERYGA